MRAETFIQAPLEATPEMIAAGYLAGRNPADVWRAMVAAIPTGTVTPAPVLDGRELPELLRGVRQARSRLDGDVDAYVLTELPPLGKVRRNPGFWTDLDVRRLVIETHRQVSVAMARKLIAAAVGAERTPSKSALARAWQRLDIAKGARRRGRR